jgi:hypothetical protein
MYLSTIFEGLTRELKLSSIPHRSLTENLQIQKRCKRRTREIAMKKLSKMIIVTLGLVLLASGIASAKVSIGLKSPTEPAKVSIGL